MIHLPFPAHDTWLKSFWLVMSPAGGLLIGGGASLFTSLPWHALALVVTLVLAIPGLLRPQIASLPYRAWNKLGRIFSCHAREWLLLTCFYLVFVAVGRTGGLLRLSHPSTAKSQWLPRATNSLAVYDGSHSVTVEAFPYRNWIPSFLAWATSTHNCWTCCLLPFLLLFVVLDSEREDKDLPAGIYTLF